ncbi:MAG: hypothetical protein GY804_08585 [Alphaproteobacteria bacterium]|nr:hypothetical protein [Alphaproteobacteria bacterium]
MSSPTNKKKRKEIKKKKRVIGNRRKVNIANNKPKKDIHLTRLMKSLKAATGAKQNLIEIKDDLKNVAVKHGIDTSNIDELDTLFEDAPT